MIKIRGSVWAVGGNLLRLGCHERDDLADVLEAVDEADDVEGGGREATGLVKILLEAKDQMLQPEIKKKPGEFRVYDICLYDLRAFKTSFYARALLG